MGLTLPLSGRQGALLLAGGLTVVALVHGNVIQRLEELIHPPIMALMTILEALWYFSARQDRAFISSGRF